MSDSPQLASAPSAPWLLTLLTLCALPAAALAGGRAPIVVGPDIPTEPSGGAPLAASPAPLGAVDADLQVTATGAASWSVPIKVPPGIRGVEPKISLSYNSGAGNDVGGVGFSVGGLSTIERCAATPAQDGALGGIGLDLGDRLCMDGLRLMRVGGAPYGKDGSIYRTEGETWSQVEAHGSCGGGPCSFTVHLKAGGVATFGGPGADACAGVGGDPAATRFAWPMTRLEDLNGDALTADWTSGGLGHCVPSRVDYTSNTVTASPPLRSVRFEYGPRPDVERAWVAGEARELSVLLTAVKTFVTPPGGGADVLVKSYEPSYALSPWTHRSRMTSLTECDAQHACLPPTTLSWSEGDWMSHHTDVTLDNTGYVWFPASTNPLTLMGDFDGSGRTDLIQIEDAHDGTGWGFVFLDMAFTPMPAWQGSTWGTFAVGGANPDKFELGDFDGDGSHDLFVVHQVSTPLGVSTVWKIYTGGPGGLSDDPTFEGGDDLYPRELRVADLDGDGRSDVLSWNPWSASATPWFWRGDHLEAGPAVTLFQQVPAPIISYPKQDEDVNDPPPEPQPVYTQTVLGDFNGDGRVDVLAYRSMATSGWTDSDYTEWRLFRATDGGLVPGPQGIWPRLNLKVNASDFNGDGLSDLLLLDTSGYLVSYSTGAGFVHEDPTPTSVPVWLVGTCKSDPDCVADPVDIPWGQTGAEFSLFNRVEVANLNDDGRSDVIVMDDPDGGAPGNGADLYAWDGAAFEFEGAIPHSGGHPYILGDLFATGRSVLFHGNDQYASWSGSAEDERPDLLIDIEDGLKGSTTISWAPMTDYAVYERGAGATWPARDYVSTRYIVTAVDRGDGQGGVYDTHYSYAGARADLSGHGFLGFERVMVSYTDGRQIETFYRQDPPFAGVAYQQDLLLSGQLTTRTSWEWIDAPDPAAPGTHQLLRTEEEVTRYGALQTPLHTSHRSTTYDLHGDALLEVDQADVSDPQTLKSTLTAYFPGGGAWHMGYPKETSVYGPQGQLMSRVQFEYDSRMNPVYEGRWDGDLGTWVGQTRSFDAWGLVTAVVAPDGGATTFTYDDYQLPKDTISPLGHTETHQMDPRFGVELSQVDAAGATTWKTYDGFGRQTSLTGLGPSGAPVEMQRFSLADPGVGLATQTFIRRDWTSNQWDWKETWIDGMRRPVKTRQRGEGNLAIVTEQEYWDEQTVYRATQPHFEGQTPDVVESWHDGEHRPELIIRPDGGVTELVYDDDARTITRTDADGAVTVMTLDARGKLVERQDPAGEITTFEYDVLGRLVKTTAPGGLTTETRWDTLGRKTSTTDATTGTTTLVYDAQGHLVEEQDAKGQRVVRQWDALDRTTAKLLYRAGDPSPYKVIEMGYDDPAVSFGAGRLTSTRVLVGAVEESAYRFSYDAQGHQRTATLNVDGRQLSWTTSHDPGGVARGVIYPDGSEMRTDMSSAGRPRQVSLKDALEPGKGWQAEGIWSGYDAAGRPAQLRQPNRVVTCYTWEAVTGRLGRTLTGRYKTPTATTCKDGDAAEEVFSEVVYTWDAMGRVLEQAELADPSRDQVFTYDPRGYLATASGIYGEQTFEYDGNGSLIQKGDVGFTLDGLKIDADTLGNSYLWDANGNLTQRQAQGSLTTYTWDVEDSLESVDKDGEITDYVHDFSGHRILKVDPDGRRTIYVSDLYEITVDAQGNELHTKYVPGPSGRLAQVSHADVVLSQVVDASGWEQRGRSARRSTIQGAALAAQGAILSAALSPSASRGVMVGIFGLLTALALGLTARTGAAGVRLVRGLRATAATRRAWGMAAVAPALAVALLAAVVLPPPAAQAMNAGVNGPGVPVVGAYYLHQSLNRSTALVTSEAGKLVSRIDYEPFGEIASSSQGDDVVRPKMAGAEWDSGAALYTMGERPYDPTLGRFLRADRSLGADPMETISLNRYAYATNNPITVMDPSGRFAVLAFFAVLAIFAIAGALIAGTNGQILTDPTHAFDGWCWQRAAVGFIIGMAAGTVAFAMGTIGAGVMILGVKASVVAVSMYIGGLSTLTFAYARGETDGGRLLAYFGIGMLGGLLASTGLGAVAQLGAIGRIIGDAAASLATSALKLALDDKGPQQLQLWAFTLTWTSDGRFDWSPDYAYLAGLAASGILRGGMLLKGEAKGWNWNEGIADDAAREASATVYGLWNASWGMEAGASMFKVAGLVTSGLLNCFIHTATAGNLGDLEFARHKLEGDYLSGFVASKLWTELGSAL